MAHSGAKSASIPGAAEADTAGHTPGPWGVNVNGGEGWSVDYDGPSSTYVTICGLRRSPVAFAVHPSAFGGDAEVDANARLIATAPELLEALRSLTEAVEPLIATPPIVGPITQRVRDETTMARATIAKATGTHVAAQSATAQPGTARSDVNQNPVPKTEGGRS